MGKAEIRSETTREVVIRKYNGKSVCSSAGTKADDRREWQGCFASLSKKVRPLNRPEGPFGLENWDLFPGHLFSGRF